MGKGGKRTTPLVLTLELAYRSTDEQQSSSNMLSATQPGYQRPRADALARRSQQPSNGMPPPSPALVRHGSKQRRGPQAGGSGLGTPSSAGNHAGIPAPSPTMQRRMSQQQNHPYATTTGAIHSTSDYRGTMGDEGYTNGGAYGRNSPMMASQVGATPATVSAVRAQGDIGLDQAEQQQQPEPSTLWKILTCKCG